MMLTLTQLWEAFLSLLIIVGMIGVFVIVLVFLFGFVTSVQGHQAKGRQYPEPVFDEKPADPFQTPSYYPQGPRLSEQADENPNEFCPLCHYHWTVCANIHVLHHEQVPTSILPNTTRSNQV